jgi:hypothetical protein
VFFVEIINKYVKITSTGSEYMNINYVNLADGSTIVTDETGKITKLDEELTGEQLIIDNKIEMLENELDKEYDTYRHHRKVAFLSKTINIAAFGLLVGTLLLTFFVDGLKGLYAGAIFSASTWIPVGIITKIIDIVANKKVKASQAVIERAGELKKELTDKLNALENDKSKKVKINKSQINEPVSLEEINENAFANIDKQLDMEYLYQMHSKPKRLVLKKEK